MKIKISFVLGFILTVGLIYSCTKSPIPSPSKSTAPNLDTISSLSEMTSDITLWNNHGQFITVTNVRSTDVENEIVDIKPNANTIDACSGIFSGVARAAAKTSYTTAALQSYANIAGIRATLQTDTYMQGLGITNSSNRTTPEQRNVSASVSYLYAIARESDNDYHLIIGDSPVSPSTLLNCEVSGLPSFKEGKVTRLEAWLKNKNLSLTDFKKSYFYSDSHNDLPLMQKVTHPVAVDADAILAEYAKSRGWPTISLR